jgi:MYXO-CTERM domain-containing protein
MSGAPITERERDDKREFILLQHGRRTGAEASAKVPSERPVSSRFLAFLACFAAFASPLDASAFCRSTTCTDSCPTDDQGCKTTGLPLRWTSSCVGMSLSKAGSDLLAESEISRVFNASLATWSAVQCAGLSPSISYRVLATVDCDDAVYNQDGPNANIVLFRDNDWPYQGLDNTLAYTTVTFDPDTGNILGADVEVNTAYNIITTSDTNVKVDLQSIMTHELGHALGLAHSSDPNATMNAVYVDGDTSIRQLADDDIAAICADYPPARDAKCDPIPPGGFISACSPPAPPASKKSCAFASASDPSPSGSLSLVAMIAVLRLRRRSSRGIPRAR